MFPKMVLSHVFGSCHKMHFKNGFLMVFGVFFGTTFKCNFLSHLLMLFCEVLGARRAPNEGPKGPPMPSTGARRKGL